MEPSSSTSIYNRSISPRDSASFKPPRSSSSVPNLEGVTATALAFSNKEPRGVDSLKDRLRILTQLESSFPFGFYEEFENILREYTMLDHHQKDDVSKLLAKVCVKFSDAIKAESLLSPLLIGSWDEATLHMLLEITNKVIASKPFVRNPVFTSFLQSNWLIASSKISSPEQARVFIDLMRAVKNYQVYVNILAKIQKEDSEISFVRVEASLLLFSAVWIRFAQKLQKFKVEVKLTQEELSSVANTFNTIRKFFRDKSLQDQAKRQPENVWFGLGQSLNLYPDERSPLSFRVRCCMVRERLEKKLNSQGLTPVSSEVYFATEAEFKKRLVPFLEMPLVSPLELVLERIISGDSSSNEGIDQFPSSLRQAQVDLERILDEIAQGGLQVVELD